MDVTENVMFEGWWVPIVGTVVTLIMASLTYAVTRLSNWIIIKAKLNEIEQEAVQAILEGMAKAQEEIVRKAKKSSADGKLTEEEVKSAESLAIEHAKAVANGPAKELLISWSTTKIKSIIKQLLAKYKS